jgi:hypothetical protein
MNYQVKNILFFVTSGLTIWILLVIYREKTSHDISFLRKIFFPNCNGWCMLHFMHYTFLSYFAPNYWKELIFMGIIFEVAEIYMNNLSKYIDSKLLEDTITNSLGIIFGKILFTMYPHKIDLMNIIKNLIKTKR